MSAKRIILVILIWGFARAIIVNAQVTVSGSTGADGTYARLALAFTAINSTPQTGNDILIAISANTTETTTATLNAGVWTSLKIYPTITGLTITGSLASPLIDLNGADNVIIDGRVNRTGSAIDLIVTNTSTSNSAGTSTIRFINTAQYDTIKYCTIKGSSTSSADGIINFSTATTGTGNSYNNIDKCSVTNNSGNRPVNAIYSLGSAGFENRNNTVSNNSIFDFLNTATSSSGIGVASNSTIFSITGNSFYETSIPFSVTAANTYFAIYINNNLGINFTITDNYIGGSAALCSSSPMTVTGNYAHQFQGIYLRALAGSTSSIQNNTIKNISYTSNSATPWCGIYILTGIINIGTSTGNNIGETTGNGSITITNTTTNSASYGIYIAASAVLFIQNNNIGSITTIGSTTYSSSIYGICKSNTGGNLTVLNNIIGSSTTTNSIQATSASTSATGQVVAGIRSTGSGAITISGNSILNLYNADNGIDGSSITRGIFVSAGSNTIQNNTVRNISSASAQATTNVSGAVIGIAVSSTANGTKQTISGNTVFNLYDTNSSAKVNVYGIYFAGTAIITDNIIFNNFIYGLSVLSTNTNGSIIGINTYTGASTIYNNVINFGGSVTTDLAIFGIYGETGSNNNIYFNTVYIGGTASGSGKATYALYDKNNSLARDYRNNIFYNARSSGGTGGTHYSIFLTGKTSLTIDYNDYYVSTAGTLGIIASTSYSALDASWRTASGGDVNSINTNPVLMIAGSTTPADYMPAVALAGLTGLGITLDILGISRTAVPTMGALERGPFWVGSTSTDYNTPGNWSNNAVPPDGINIFFADNPDRSCYLDADRIVRAIIINQNTDKLVTNGHKLTINGTLALSNSGQIDASSTSSIVEFGGSYPQPVPSGAFYNNEVFNIIVNNANNITFSGTLRLLNTITCTSGVLDVITNSPTLVYAGSSSQTIENGQLLSNRAYNLTVDNSTTATLNTTFTINNNLVINSGKKLTVAAGKSLTVSGTITNSAGNGGLFLKSDATGTASLIHNTASVPATAERYLSGAAESWHFISSPVSTQPISGTWLPSGTYGNGTGYDLYVWNEATNCWIYKLDVTSAVNWNTVHPGANFTSGRGYLYSVQAVNPTKEFAGNLNNGTINYALTFSSTDLTLKGFNLVGNPYPSAIDWRAASGWTRTNLKSTAGGFDMWIYNPTANNYGVYNSADADGTGTNSVTRYIAPMQGYFVLASGAGNLSMTNAVRIADPTISWIKGETQAKAKAKVEVEAEKKLSVIVKADAGFGSDEVQLRFGYAQNEMGARKLFSRVITAPSLYLASEGSNLSIHYYTDTNENPFVPVSFTSGVNGKYTIECNFENDKFETVMLEDRQLHYIHNIKERDSYSFQSSTTDNPDRFVIHFGPETNPPPKYELPGKIYSNGYQIVIDLTLISKETTALVSDLQGRILLQKNLQGETEYKLDFNSATKILVVQLRNPDGKMSRRLLWLKR